MSVRFKVESVTLTTFDETVTMVIEPVNESDKLSKQMLDNLGRFSFRAPGFRPGEAYELKLVEESVEPNQIVPQPPSAVQAASESIS